MSLLMEALKKAEQAKRNVAEGPVVVSVVPAPLALEPTSVEASAAQPVPLRVTETPPTSTAPVLTAAAFTLMTGRLAESSPVLASAPAPVAIVPLRMEVTAPTPSSPEPQAPAQIPRAPAKPELSLDKSAPVAPTPAAAARHLPSRRRIPALWIGIGVALLFALSGGGYWYYNSMAQYLTQQATLGPPQTALAQAVAPPVEPAPVMPPSSSVAAAKTPPRSMEKALPASKPRNVRSLPPVSAPTAASVPAPVVAVPSEVAAPVSEVVASVPVPPPAPAPISISRDAEQNDTFSTLQAAYRAYQNGDDTSAQKLYAQVLGRDDHNRDALLGLAAITVRQKDFVRAQEIYSELLILDPKDSVAQAGFVSVTGSFDPLQQEARIKALLEQEPGAPHLLFTYASFLMKQQRWLEATRSLQSALQGQRDNADYAFNLAVSFDHLGQIDAAVKYYRTALELAAKQSASFRPDDVRKRLQAMSANGSGGRLP